MAFIIFFGALIATYLLTRTTNAWFVKVMSARKAAWLSFGVWGGLVAFAMASRMVPLRVTGVYVVIPLVIWLVFDLARANQQVCRRCGKRAPKTALVCPRCGAGLGTGASIM